MMFISQGPPALRDGRLVRAFDGDSGRDWLATLQRDTLRDCYFWFRRDIARVTATRGLGFDLVWAVWAILGKRGPYRIAGREIVTGTSHPSTSTFQYWAIILWSIHVSFHMARSKGAYTSVSADLVFGASAGIEGIAALAVAIVGIYGLFRITVRGDVARKCFWWFYAALAFTFLYAPVLTRMFCPFRGSKGCRLKTL